MPFAYLRDPLFLICFASYFVNRWLIRPNVDEGFLHSYFNDLICIPFGVPPLVCFARQIGLRKHDGRPAGIELLLPCFLWSIYFELWLPNTHTFRGRAIGDPWDIIAYLAGAIGASFLWDWWYQPSSSFRDEQP